MALKKTLETEGTKTPSNKVVKAAKTSLLSLMGLLGLSSCAFEQGIDSNGNSYTRRSLNINGVSAYGKNGGININGGGYGGYGIPVFGNGGNWNGGNGGGYTEIVRDPYGQKYNRGVTAVSQRPVARIYHHAPDGKATAPEAYQQMADLIEFKDGAGQTFMLPKQQADALSKGDIIHTDKDSGQSIALPVDVYKGLSKGLFTVAQDETGVITVVSSKFEKDLKKGDMKIYRGSNKTPMVVPSDTFDSLVKGKAKLIEDKNGNFQFKPDPKTIAKPVQKTR